MSTCGQLSVPVSRTLYRGAPYVSQWSVDCAGVPYSLLRRPLCQPVFSCLCRCAVLSTEVPPMSASGQLSVPLCRTLY